MTEIIFEYNPVYEKGKKFKKLDDAIDFLDNRTKYTFQTMGIAGLEMENNAPKLIIDAIEVDEFLNRTDFKAQEEIGFFIPKYVYNHLAEFLGMTSAKYSKDYQRYLSCEKENIEKLLELEGNILKILFEDRHKKGDKADYLTVFDDGFGKYPRVWHSKVYSPYPDSKALDKMLKGFEAINARSTLNYEFDELFATPFKSTLTFLNKETKPLLIKGDEYEKGIVIQNSECKGASFNFRATMKRKVCDNGAITEFNKDLAVRHYENGFERRVQKAFTEALKLPDQHASEYLKALEYDDKISDNWADFVEIPKEFVSMRASEKEEMVSIARRENYDFNVNGIIQAITYKNSHDVYDDDNYERLNAKVLNVMRNANRISHWRPRTIDATLT